MKQSLYLAACAALASMGLGSSAMGQVTPPPTQDPVTIRPVYVDEPVAVEAEAVVEAEADRPLMGLIKGSEGGRDLADQGFFINGHAQASWTIAEPTPDSGLIVGRLFDQEDQDVTFNQLYFAIGRTIEVTPDTFEVGGQVDVLWGGDARFMHSNGFLDDNGFNNGPDEQWDIPQMYAQLGVPVGTGLGLKIGKWSTLGGYEVVVPTGNALYSHGYIFNSCLPFAHTGVLGTYSLNDQVALDLGVSRGWDQAWEDNNDMIDFIARLSWASADERTAVYTTGYIGPQLDNNQDWRYVLDIVATHAYADNVATALNFNYGYDEGADPNGGAGQWGALEGWGTLDFSDQVAVSSRLGWINDDNGTRGFGCDIYHATVGLQLTPFASDLYGQWFVVRPEVRADYAENDIFEGDNLQATFGIDAYYAF